MPVWLTLSESHPPPRSMYLGSSARLRRHHCCSAPSSARASSAALGLLKSKKGIVAAGPQIYFNENISDSLVALNRDSATLF